MLRAKKNDVFRLVKNWLPLYAQMYAELKRGGGRVVIENRFHGMRSSLASFYVTLYEDERKIPAVWMMGLMGLDDFNQLKADAESWSSEELNQFVETVSSEETEQVLVDAIHIPTSDAEWKASEDGFKALSLEEQRKINVQSSCFFSALFAQIFNVFAVMTHGATLHTLVVKAMSGDDEAFGKAVQVDRFLLTHHPYFVARKARAQDEGDRSFLRNLSTRENNPNLKGRIRYAPLFLLFGMLDSMRWLDDLSNEEILTLCDEAGLDRFQNRIEDPMYVSKRLAEYRRYQKTGDLSMPSL